MPSRNLPHHSFNTPTSEQQSSIPTSSKGLKTTMSTAHYTVPIPDSATICPDWPSLCEETRSKYGQCTLDKKYGGYIIEDKGVICLVCTDNLCTIIEEKDREAATITFHHPASGVPIGNYTVTLPETARVCSDWPSLNAAALQQPHAAIVKKHGGWVIEEEGAIVIACDEGMSVRCDERPEQLEFIAGDVAELLRAREGRQNASGR
jgi:hypothetical protein